MSYSMILDAENIVPLRKNPQTVAANEEKRKPKKHIKAVIVPRKLSECRER
jgi:hypothetical protein